MWVMGRQKGYKIAADAHDAFYERKTKAVMFWEKKYNINDFNNKLQFSNPEFRLC